MTNSFSENILLHGVSKLFFNVPDISTSLFSSYPQNRTNLIDPNYEGVFKSFRTGRLNGELQMIKLSATKGSFIAIL
jgi:hypothetical protein